jgi:hypothetical protein
MSILPEAAQAVPEVVTKPEIKDVPTGMEPEPTPAPADVPKSEDKATPAETPLAEKDSEDWPEGTAEWAKKEITKLRAKARRERTQRENVEAERDRLRIERVAKPEAAVAPVQTPRQDTGPQAPREADFANYDEYLSAREEFIADKARRATRAEIEAENRKRQSEVSQAEERKRMIDARKRFEDSAKDVSEHYEDFDEAMQDMWAGSIPAIAQSDAMAEYVIEVSERGPELAYHLHSNPKEASRIAKLTPLAQVRELARLEATLPKPESRNISKAPSPPKTVKATGGASGKDIEALADSDMKAFSDMRKAERAKRNQY